MTTRFDDEGFMFMIAHEAKEEEAIRKETEEDETQPIRDYESRYGRE